MTSRTELLHKLRDLRISEVVVKYSGSGDEGFIDQISPNPPEVEGLEDFFWEDVIGFTSHSGFHNGDGGFGTIVWNIETDSIRMQHNDYQTITYQHPMETI